MNSLDPYSQGIRSGTEINRLERDAMKDAFLSDALDGYDATKGNHAERIAEIRKEIAVRTVNRNKILLRRIAFAGIILLLIVGGIFLLNKFVPSWENKKIVITTEHPAIENAIPDTDTQLPEMEGEEMPSDENEYTMSNTLTEELPETENTDSVLPENLELEPIQTPELSNIKLLETTKSPQETDDLLDFDYSSLENQVPKPVIGIPAYREYLATEMIRPTDKKCSKAKGNVLLSFHIDKNGHPINILVKKSLCPGADAEALRLLINGPDWSIGNKEVELEIRF
jgi:hypothetical protein